jgi:hypothetical protein
MVASIDGVAADVRAVVVMARSTVRPVAAGGDGTAYRRGVGVHAPPHTDRRAHPRRRARTGPAARLVRSSHEAWDGSGYPDALAGVDIPLGARIIAVCDSFDAMISDRPTRPRSQSTTPSPRSGAAPERSWTQTSPRSSNGSSSTAHRSPPRKRCRNGDAADRTVDPARRRTHQKRYRRDRSSRWSSGGVSLRDSRRYRPHGGDPRKHAACAETALWMRRRASRGSGQSRGMSSSNRGTSTSWCGRPSKYKDRDQRDLRRLLSGTHRRRGLVAGRYRRGRARPAHEQASASEREHDGHDEPSDVERLAGAGLTELMQRTDNEVRGEGDDQQPGHEKNLRKSSSASRDTRPTLERQPSPVPTSRPRPSRSRRRRPRHEQK